MKLPYGLADFPRLMRDGYLYVDRTGFIPLFEELGTSLLFLRPRRFGKSLWLQTLRSYYDVLGAGGHDTLFAGLEAGRNPTPEAHAYFVLQWNFSYVEPRGSADAIGARLAEYVNATVRTFSRTYRDLLPEQIRVESNPVVTLDNMFALIRETRYRLYLMIDEYDNFANEVMMSDAGGYADLVHGDGPFKSLMKSVKGATEGQGAERLFLTGVSPIVLSDVTSGLNICDDVSRYPELATLCGFTQSEVRDLVERLHHEQAETGDRPRWSADEAVATMRTWYDGYRFAADDADPVYNPTLALYFLKHVGRTGAFPERMLDANLATEQGKLSFISERLTGRRIVMDVIQADAPITLGYLKDRFTLSELRSDEDPTSVASLLYYFGMLTLAGRTEHRRLRLTVPNLVTQRLYVEQLRALLLPEAETRHRAVAALLTERESDIEPLLQLMEELLRTFSTRDLRWMNELTVKAILLTLLFDDVTYVHVSEPELERGCADLCLLRRPELRAIDLPDLLFELKFVSLRDLRAAGEELRQDSNDALRDRKPVARALDQGDEQLRRYRAALERRYGDSLRLRAFTIVALGAERLVGRELAD